MSSPPKEAFDSGAALKRLYANARLGEKVSVHVFLHGASGDPKLEDEVKNIVERAAGAAGDSLGGPEIRKISRLARSFSLSAEPRTLEALAKQPEVKGILPAQIEDVYPAPVRRSDVD